MTREEKVQSLLTLDEAEREAFALFQAWDRDHPLAVPETGKAEVPESRPQGKTVVIPTVLDEQVTFRESFDVALTRHPRYFTSVLHCHLFFEIVYVANGICHQLVDGREFVLRKGDVCIMPPKVMHAPEAFGESDLVFNLQLRQSTFRTAFSSLLRRGDILSDFFLRTVYGERPSRFLLFRTGDDGDILDLMLTMFEEAGTEGEYSNRFLQAYCDLFFAKLLRGYRDRTQVFSMNDARPDSVFVPILRYVEQNLENVTLGALAAQFHYSQSQIGRLFREYTGGSFSDCLRERRLSRAAELLANTELSVQMVAEQVGYLSASEFYRIFRSRYGVTPAVYREQAREKET